MKLPTITLNNAEAEELYQLSHTGADAGFYDCVCVVRVVCRGDDGDMLTTYTVDCPELVKSLEKLARSAMSDALYRKLLSALVTGEP